MIASVSVLIMSCKNEQKNTSIADNAATKTTNNIDFKAGKNEVTFKSKGVLLAGLIFTPENFDETQQYPTVVYSGPLTTMFYEAASEPKELFEVPGASHVSLYDQEDHVNQAIAKMDEFFRRY